MTTTDPFDDLAAIFMTTNAPDSPTQRGPGPGGSGAPAVRAVGGRAKETESIAVTERTRGAEPATRTTIEVLLVGHLPVRAALWLTPYADAVARNAGTTALVRLDGDEPLVQVLRGDRAGPITAARNLRETILEIGAEVDAWIIRPSLQTAVSTLIDATMAHPATAASGGSVPRFTILSSADQAAVVNAYRLVKDLVETAARTDAPIPDIGLAVIGTDRETAEAVAERLSRTTIECLGITVPLTHCLTRIDSQVRGSALRTFPGRARPDLDDVVSWIREATRRVPAPTQAAPDPEPPTIEIPRAPTQPVPTQPVPTQPVPTQPVPTQARVVPIAAPHAEPSRAAERSRESARPAVFEGLRDAGTVSFATPSGARLEPKVATSRAALDLEPKPTDAREPHENGAPVPLASFIDGLDPLAPRCPDHERVELAVDGAGGLHLLCREDAFRSLVAVSAWVRSHRELLGLACPDHTFEPTGRATLHVFTDAPLKAADLHGSDVRCHVLAPVKVGDQTGWYCAPLNRA